VIKMYEFEIRTGTVFIDHNKCKTCESFDCVKACSIYGRNILRIRNGSPVIIVPPEEVKRRDNECLACELHCPYGAVKVVLPFEELEKFRRG